ncbi:hypothetical protein C8R43DRAFT_1102680 [Mycena crocata]|nr:hypothetical protein C8R43DRAFT_1102680 [Mycena crocata]
MNTSREGGVEGQTDLRVAVVYPAQHTRDRKSERTHGGTESCVAALSLDECLWGPSLFDAADSIEAEVAQLTHAVVFFRQIWGVLDSGQTMQEAVQLLYYIARGSIREIRRGSGVGAVRSTLRIATGVLVESDGRNRERDTGGCTVRVAILTEIYKIPTEHKPIPGVRSHKTLALPWTGRPRRRGRTLVKTSWDLTSQRTMLEYRSESMIDAARAVWSKGLRGIDQRRARAIQRRRFKARGWERRVAREHSPPERRQRQANIKALHAVDNQTSEEQKRCKSQNDSYRRILGRWSKLRTHRSPT